MNKSLVTTIKEAAGLPRRFLPQRLLPKHFGDMVFQQLTRLCAVFILLLIVTMGWQLTQSAWPAVQKFGFGFLTETAWDPVMGEDRKSTRLNSSHVRISYAVFCLKKKKKNNL